MEKQIPGPVRGSRSFFPPATKGVKRITRPVFWFSIIFSLIIFCDYYLPRREVHSSIENIFFYIDEQQVDAVPEMMKRIKEMPNAVLKLSSPEGEIALNPSGINFEDVLPGNPIVFVRTMLFQTTLYIYAGENKVRYEPYISNYGALLLIPLALFVFSLIALLARVSDDAAVTLVIIEVFLLLGFVFVRVFYF